uniref:Uncharacterized protein n=1 Tax=Tanacetum cinerariifolium TaxID=118510 RepID=A0A699JI17_TANCI|nr:hypothetical protein [Tanacetum cinerariifolium]
MRNVPRPSHGEISCSGSGTHGVEQILLDDHHIDDDDDEGVELTKPVVKPSNAIRSNILNLLPDPTDHPKISPSVDEFDDQIVQEPYAYMRRTLMVLGALTQPGNTWCGKWVRWGNKAAMEKRAAGNGLAGVNGPGGLNKPAS